MITTLLTNIGQIVYYYKTLTSSGTIGATEHNRAGYCTGRHVEGLGSRIDHLINSLHAEVESHKLAYRLQSRLWVGI